MSLLRTRDHGARIVFIYRPHGAHASAGHVTVLPQHVLTHDILTFALFLAGLSREAVLGISRRLQSDGLQHFMIQPAFRPTKPTAKCMQNGRMHDEQRAASSAVTGQAVPAQQPQGCELCTSHADQGVRVLTLSANDAVWPLLAAAQLVDAPGGPSATKLGGKLRNDKYAQVPEQPPPAFDLAQELVRVAGPAAALEPHIVLVCHAKLLCHACSSSGLSCSL